jgi:hypothetical protein
MNRDYLIKHSTYFKELLTDDIIVHQENIKEITSKFPDCFIEFMNEFIENKRTKNLSIDLESYIKIYETIDMFGFKRDIFLRELEKHYKGTRNIYELSGEGWDLYLPETFGLYTMRNVYPINRRNVKTQYKIKLEITDVNCNFLIDEKVDEIITNLFLFHVKVFYFNPPDNQEIIKEEQTLYTIPKWILKIMKNIEILIFGAYYNQKINLSNFINLRELTFGVNYNQKTNLSNLTNLRKLRFSGEYNQKTDLSNLINLKVLIFGSDYNQETNLTGLVNLRELYFGCDYNQEINLSNLVNLRILVFGNNYDQKTDLTNLKNLRELTFGSKYNQETNLSNLRNLEILDFFEYYNQKTNLSSLVNLKVLRLGEYYNQETDLSSLVNLRELRLGEYCNFPIDISNCKKIQTVIVDSKFSSKITNPQKVKIKVLGLLSQ